MAGELQSPPDRIRAAHPGTIQSHPILPLSAETRACGRDVLLISLDRARISISRDPRRTGRLGQRIYGLRAVEVDRGADCEQCPTQRSKGLFSSDWPGLRPLEERPLE